MNRLRNLAFVLAFSLLTVADCSTGTQMTEATSTSQSGEDNAERNLVALKNTTLPPNPCDAVSCSHGCDVNDDGGAHCTCPVGKELDVDEKTCKDIPIKCPAGYKPNAARSGCVDIDECQQQPPVCGHSCVNTPGSYQCGCPDGYRLHPNGIHCIDINECRINNGGCSDTCYNTPGSFNCKCPRGFQLMAGGKICEQKYKCLGFGCAHNCHQAEVWYEPYCTCNLGYKLADNGKDCVDMNECGFFHRCDTSSGATCVNVVGSYKCVCNEPNKVLSADKLKCELKAQVTCSSLGCSNGCDDTRYPPVCTCPNGYRLDTNGRDCSDVDECAEQTHGCTDTCINTAGDYRCECPAGKRLSNDLKTCVSLSHVACPMPTLFRGSVNCTSTSYNPGTICTRSCRTGFALSGPPSIRCQDNGVWTPDIPAQCTDIDECANNNGGCEQTCINFLGQHACACQSGFLLRTDRKHCKDAENPEFTNCPSNIEVNTQLSYATVTWPEVTYTDNVGVVNVVGPQTNEQNFTIGVHKVKITIFDAEGNSALCSFKVHVKDLELPVVSNCPDDINRFVLEGVMVKEVTWPEPTFSDNSGSVTVTDNIPTDNLFPMGEYNVRYQAADPSGNIAVCTFLVNLTRVNCPDLRQPVNGSITCDTSAINPFCEAKCDAGFEFLKSPPEQYVCGADGGWIPTDNVPDCHRTFTPTAAKATFSARYAHVCKDPENDPVFIKQTIMPMFQSQHVQSLQFACINKPCTFTDPVITCREKDLLLTFSSNEDLSGGLDLDAYVNGVLAEVQKQRYDSFFLTLIIPGTPEFFFPPIADLENRKIDVQLSLTCADGQVQIRNKCVECPPGEPDCPLIQPGLA
ncbi:fibrillin-1 [Lingula anatina]|uniref:Fibrillin-1 n=1 Tax=Lingula anatina TaxID=7574 RepID=A0A1S3HZR5_LINAN|nr:fibrillin-1 [Lingula anatina]|eukprot:XP_013390584.1 fibrillin-1 [Lingula anatina]